jgi:pantothenate synthetase
MAIAAMKKHSVKKHSVRYNAATDDDAKVLVSIYVMKTAFGDIDYYPEKIIVDLQEVKK